MKQKSEKCYIRRFRVKKSDAVDIFGDGEKYYSTPSLVRDAELTCRDLLCQLGLEKGNSVVSHVAIDHLAPTHLGEEVEIATILIDVMGNLAKFDILVSSNKKTISKGIVSFKIRRQ